MLANMGVVGLAYAAVQQSALRAKSLRETRIPIVASNSALLFANTLVQAAFGVVFWTLAARIFSVAEVGFNAAVISACTLVATFANLGLSAVVVRYVPAAGQHARILSVVATAIPAVAATLIVSLGFAFPYWPLASDLLSGGTLGVVVPAALAVGTSVTMVQDSIFIARHQSRYVLSRGVLAAALRLGLLFGFSQTSAYGLILIFLGGTLLAVALGTRAWFPHTFAEDEETVRRALESIAPQGEIIRYSLSNYMSGLFAQAPQLVYPMLIASQVSHGAAGAFSFAWMAASLLLQLPPSAANVLMSQLIRDPKGTSQRVAQATRVLVAAMLGLSMVIGLGVAVFAYVCLPTAAGEIAAYLPLLLLGALLYAPVRMQSMHLSLNGRLGHLTVLNGAVALLAVALPLALLPNYGVIGLEVGWGISQVVGVLLSRLFRDQRTRFQGPSTLAKRCL